MDTELRGAFSLLKLDTQGIGRRVFSFLEMSSCTPWQYCSTYGLDFTTFSTITGVREVAGGRQPAAANNSCIM